MKDLMLIFGQWMVYPAIALVFMFGARCIENRRTKFDDDALVLEGNTAIALRKAGIYLGLAIGIVGPLSTHTGGFFGDVWNLCLGGIFLVPALFAAFFVNEYFMLSSVNNDEALKKGNVAVGIVEFCSYVGSGLFLNGAFTNGNGIGDIGVSMVFFALGQAALVAVYYAYAMYYRMTSQSSGARDLPEVIEQESDVPAAIDVGGFLISFSFLLRASLVGDFTGWGASLGAFGCYCGFGLVLLLVYRLVVNKFFMPRVENGKLTDEPRNVAMALMESALQIAVAIVISFSV
ncbi:MAG: DUF350 domain-containing protein [Parcubacteria group bacterium]|jgi:uncharacterized membrane protein YjfL (UPF0719 family)